MPAYPLTACAAVNALGCHPDEIVDGIARGRTGIRPCLELGDPPPMCGWLDTPTPLPAAHAHLDGRATRVFAVTLASMHAAIEGACTRWGASRVGAVIAAPIADTDAMAVALRLGRPPPRETADAIVELLLSVSPLRGPAYACIDAGAAGAVATIAALRLLQAGIVDAVLTGGCQVLGRASVRASSRVPFGEGAALMLLERHGDGFVELVAGVRSPDDHAAALLLASAPRGVSDVGYRHVVGALVQVDALVDVASATTTPATGDLMAAAGASEIVIAALCLERGLVPPWSLSGPSRAALEGDAVIVDAAVGRGRVAVLLRARSA